jgi:Zn-finger nucleic acid-binding protein
MSPYRQAPTASRICPRCSLGLSRRTIGDARIDECASCKGVFVETELIDRIVDALDLGGEIMSTFPRAATAPIATSPAGPTYIKCPNCDVLMNRRLFATGAKVIVDVCFQHGTWFDAAELRAVAEFAAGGGLERAAERDAAERAKQRAQARRNASEPILAIPEQEEAQVGLLTEILSFFLRR